MPKFYYIERDNAGGKLSGSEEAASEDELIARLQAKEYVVISVLPEFKEGSPQLKEESLVKAKLAMRRYRITSEDLALFCRQLSTLLAAGVTILKCLDIISQQVASRKLYNVIKDLKRAWSMA